MKRFASAKWVGTSKEGQGDLTTESGVLKNTQYSFRSRFESGIGTNPEELIAAAHAGCFTMALSGLLSEAGFVADLIETTATLSMEKTDAGPTVTGIHLEVIAQVPRIDIETFESSANEAKAKCPVSRLLNTNISLSARLSSLPGAVSL